MKKMLILLACAAALLIITRRKKAEWLLNVVMRGVLGAIGIYFINSVLTVMGISLGVGINVITVLISGILGFPGLAALYGIGIYQML